MRTTDHRKVLITSISTQPTFPLVKGWSACGLLAHPGERLSCPKRVLCQRPTGESRSGSDRDRKAPGSALQRERSRVQALMLGLLAGLRPTSVERQCGHQAVAVASLVVEEELGPQLQLIPRTSYSARSSATV